MPQFTGVTTHNHGLKLSLTLGLACLVAHTLCSITGQIGIFSGIFYFNYLGFLACCIVSLMMMAGVVIFKSSIIRKGLSILNLVISCLWIISAVYCIVISGSHSEPGDVALLLFASCSRVASMILTIQWSFHVAICGEKEIVLPIALAMFLAALMYVITCGIGGRIALWITCALLLISAILLIREEFKVDTKAMELLDYFKLDSEAGAPLGRCRINHCMPSSGQFGPGERLREPLDQTGAESDKQALIGASLEKRRMRFNSLTVNRIKLYGSRVGWGIFFGVLISAVSMFRPPITNSWVIVLLVSVLLVMGIVILLVLRNNKYVPLETASFVPLLISGAVFICFYDSDMNSYTRIFAVLCHITWFTQMFYQVPVYQRLLRMDPAVFAYSDKLCSFITFECTMWIILYTPVSTDSLLSSPQIVHDGALAFTVVLLAISVFIMVRHFMSYYPKRFGLHEKGFADSTTTDEAPKDRVEALAEQYRLTERETDVFRLLASGYSRPFIQKSLFLSEGTIKTHVRNIYLKLRINSRDDLLTMVHATQADAQRQDQGQGQGQGQDLPIMTIEDLRSRLPK